MKMLDIFELCIKSGYTYKQFANFTRSNWSDIGSTPYGYNFYPHIKLLHEDGKYTIEQIKASGIRDIIRYFDDWKKYNIEGIFTEKEIFANSGTVLQYVNGYPIEKILENATYPNEALPEIIDFGIKKGSSLADFLKKDKFIPKYASVYLGSIQKHYGADKGSGFLRLFEEAKKDIESGSVKFGYDDISWMRPLETEEIIRSYYNAPEIADEIFGKQKGGEYKINYTI